MVKITKTAAKAALRNLKKVETLLGPKGEHWIKRSWDDGEGNFCVLGALEKADGPGEKLAKLVVCNAIKGGALDWLDCDDFYVWKWNDDKDRKFPEVKRLLRKAQRKLEKQLAPKA